MIPKLSSTITALTLATLVNMPIYGQSDRASQASMLSTLGTSTLIEGSIELLAASPVVLIESVQQVGDNIFLVVSHAAQSAQMTLKLSVRAVGVGSLAAGQLITITSTVAGLLLTHAGAIIAWLPNTLGHRLAYEQELVRR